MSEFTSMAKVESYDECFLLKIDKEKQFHDLLHRLGNGCKVKVTIQYEDPRQEWIDKWYTEARRRGVHLMFRKDVVIAYNDFGDIATAAPVHGDKYYRHTGIAVAYAKLCGEKIPEYI